MPDLAFLLQYVPDWLRDFIVPIAACCYIYYFVRERRTAEEMALDKRDAEKANEIRDDNDKQAVRIGDLEEALSNVRRTYEAAIDKMRRDFTFEIARLTRDLDRGWDLARDWCTVAHDQRHWVNNILMRVPEDKRPPLLAPLPGLERRLGVRSDQFPPRFTGSTVADEPRAGEAPGAV